MTKREKPKPLSDQLREAVLNCGQTRYRIAQETGITEGQLSRFVRGHSRMTLDTLDILAAYLNLEVVRRK
jgi:transcriptional regulator with XRE-family HTH domain